MKLALILLAMQPVGCLGNNTPYADFREPAGGIYGRHEAELNGDQPFFIIGIRHKTDWSGLK